MKFVRSLFFPFLLVAAAILTTSQGVRIAAAGNDIHIGAVFPLHGTMSPLAREEYRGIQIAQQITNASGGVNGHRIVIDTREVDDPSQAPAAMRSLRAHGIQIVIGAYSSALSIPASQSAHANGLLYWESGAVADRLTGRGLSNVFRVGASGSNLGSNSIQFVAAQLAARLGKRPAAIRVSVVWANDDYATSVAAAAVTAAKGFGIPIVSRTRYDLYNPDWASVIASVKRAHPDVLVLASHIPDGVAFRRAMLSAHLRVGAFIGSTMAQCVPEFGAIMKQDAIGVFASDRPGSTFNPRALQPAARSIYRRLAQAWQRQTGLARPSEEGLAGFTAAWALFHVVLPQALHSGSLTVPSVSRAADSVNMAPGTLPNGAGLQFATDSRHLGQNRRAAAVIWQWQAVRHSVVVWPRTYATGHIKLVPLPR